MRPRQLLPIAGAVVVATVAACGPSAASRGDGTAAAVAPASPAPAVAESSSTDAPSPRAPNAPAPSGAGRVPNAPAPDGQPARPDTVRGIVAVVGSEPMTQTVLRPAGGAPSVTLTGDASAGVRSLSGAEVVARGTRTGPRELRVTSFTVRTVDGVAAADGVLERADGGYALRLADGTRRPVVRPSPALVAYLGARVWVTGAADAEPQSFGLIER